MTVLSTIESFSECLVVFGVFVRSTSSIWSRVPSTSRAAASQSPRERRVDVDLKSLDGKFRDELSLISGRDESTVKGISSVSSGDGSLISWLLVPNTKSCSYTALIAFFGGRTLVEAFLVLVVFVGFEFSLAGIR